MSDKPCGQCANFSEILVAGRRKTGRGWCEAHSVYPAHSAPPGAKQAVEGERPRPYIVETLGIVRHCQQWRRP